MANKRFTKSRFWNGSALILTVVLTSLLAIVGVLFLLVARLDKMATSAISQNKELNLAVGTAVAKISQELVLDVPGVAGQEYYDYPDSNNIWLANLEPNNIMMWQHISDIYDVLDINAWDLEAEIVPDYQEPAVMKQGLLADADGDGVADSRWVIIPDMTSSKGKPIYAAIRVVDNGGMLNVNTAYEFDPCNPNIKRIDGSSQIQIDLLTLAERGSTSNPLGKLDDARFGSEPHILDNYINDVVWRYDIPNGNYTPFDIGDELVLRNRYILNNDQMTTRIENLWTNAFKGGLEVPLTSPSEINTHPRFWGHRVSYDFSDANIYDYLHISTTYNMDRIINPAGGNMKNINTASKEALYSAIYAGLKDGKFGDDIATSKVAAQVAVNLIDFRDPDSEVTTYFNTGDSNMYYGFEAQPFISEIGFIVDSNDPVTPSNNYFALELYNPFEVNIPLTDFELILIGRAGGAGGRIRLRNYTIDAGGRFVITNSSAASIAFGVTNLISEGKGREDGRLVLATYTQTSIPPNPPVYALVERYDIYLIRRIGVEGIYLDKQNTQDNWFDWNIIKGVQEFYCRPDNNWNIVYQDFMSASNTLGIANGLVGGRKNYNIPTFTGGFVTVGDIARVLTIGPSADPCNTIGEQIAAAEPNEVPVRFDLQNSAFQQIFNYLTVFPPAEYVSDPNETRIKGRININTAPWFVIAQLPWVSQRKAGYNNPALAQDIVAYRDEVKIPKGFESIGELMNIVGMDYYKAQTGDLPDFPDLTWGDGAADDFEERDLIFSRISNLVTVRSDVFTAYILVRIGNDGPQKRVVAILDRSNVNSPSNKVRIVALHPVPDPR